MRMFVQEIWKDVFGYIGSYQVSNFGRVKSLKRVTFDGRLLKERTLKLDSSNQNYYRVHLCKDSKHRTLLVHRLVAKAFISNFESKPEVNHIDGDKENNKVENLEWCTHKENHVHRAAVLRRGVGENNGSAKLNRGDVLSIRDSELSDAYLAKVYKVEANTINRIRNNKRWRHI